MLDPFFCQRGAPGSSLHEDPGVPQ